MKYPFRPGMTASVDIITETKRDVLSVPLASVTTRKKGSGEEDAEGERRGRRDNDEEEEVTTLDEELDEVVFTVVEGEAVKTIVKTGISDFERIEITEGVQEGDKVVSGPFLAVSKRLKDGDAVESNQEDEEKEEDSSEED